MSHIPPYVYVLFLVLLWMGIARSFPRTIRVERLLIMPALMAILGVRSFFALFPAPGGPDLLAALAGAAVGLAIGYRHVERWETGVDRTARTISLPGDVMMLVVILATFAFEFALHYGVESHANWAAGFGFSLVAAAIWCLFVGMSAGRNLNLALRFFRSEAIPHAAAPKS